MRERDPDDLALVLEGEDVADLLLGAEDGIAIGPDVDQQPEPFDPDLGKGRVMEVAVDDNLAAPGRGLHCDQAGSRHVRRRRVGGKARESVVEDRDLERRSRDLGGTGRVTGGAERAVLRRRLIGAVLAVGGEGDPLVGRGVVATLAHPASGTFCAVTERAVAGGVNTASTGDHQSSRVT